MTPQDRVSMEKQVPNVAGPWAGRLYGTNAGNVFIELQQEETSLRGIARFLDDAFGLVIYELTGSVGERIDLKLVPKEAPDGIEVGEGTAFGHLQPDGTLRGQWQETKRCQEPFLLTQGVGEARLAPHGASVTYRCRRRDLSRIEPG